MWCQERGKDISCLIIPSLEREDHVTSWQIHVLGQPRARGFGEGAESDGLILELRQGGDTDLAVPLVTLLQVLTEEHRGHGTRRKLGQRGRSGIIGLHMDKTTEWIHRRTQTSPHRASPAVELGEPSVMLQAWQKCWAA